MLTKFRVKNFKCLQDTKDLEIRPLTFLVGPNSSGKSSLLQMLLMLRQTVDSTDINNPLATSNGWVQMGAYPEFIYGGDYNKDLELSLELTEPRRKSTKKRAPNKILLKIIFGYNRKTTQTILKKREIQFIGKEVIREKILHLEKVNRYSLSVYYKENGKQKKWFHSNIRPIKFYDYSIKVEKRLEDLRKSLPTSLFLLLMGLGAIIEEELRRLFYLGPLREYPKRIYVTSGQAPQDVGIRGERAVDVFWFSRRSRVKRIRKIEKEIKSWFKKFAIASDVKLSRLGNSNYFRVTIIDPITRTEINFADIGFGASQTLPIIIESFYAPPNSMILIEQPEIHLHPNAQAILGDLFIKATKEANRHFIIETHSEHILARVRRRIAENKVKKENIAIYYFHPTSRGITIKEITLNDMGQYETFPKGFFEEDVVEAFAHLKAIKSKK